MNKALEELRKRLKKRRITKLDPKSFPYLRAVRWISLSLKLNDAQYNRLLIEGTQLNLKD